MRIDILTLFPESFEPLKQSIIGRLIGFFNLIFGELNEEEKALLEQEEYQGKLAWGIYVGIMDYFLEPINNN